MGKCVGKDCAVKLGTNAVTYMGTWSLSGTSVDQLDTSAFGDTWKQYSFGLKDGGQISFAGFYDPADTTGQNALRFGNAQNSALTTLRLYVNSVSYYEPCATTSYFSPAITNTGSTPGLSSVYITSFDISADKSGMVNVSFTAKVSGVMVLI
jgi:hypothetical protein